MVHQLIKKHQKTQLHTIGQSGGFLCTLLGQLLKTGLPLMKNVLKAQSKSVLIPLGLTAAGAATNAATYKKMFQESVLMGYTSFILSENKHTIQ